MAHFQQTKVNQSHPFTGSFLSLKEKFTLAVQNCLAAFLSVTGLHTLQDIICLHPSAYNNNNKPGVCSLFDSEKESIRIVNRTVYTYTAEKVKEMNSLAY